MLAWLAQTEGAAEEADEEEGIVEGWRLEAGGKRTASGVFTSHIKNSTYTWVWW